MPQGRICILVKMSFLSIDNENTLRHVWTQNY